MDKEMQSTKTSRCNVLGVLTVAALLLCVVLSTIAMVMSVLTFNNYQRELIISGPPADDVDTKWETEVLAMLEEGFEKEGVMRFSHPHHKSPVDDKDMPNEKRESEREELYNDICNSTKDNNTDVKPLAHITAPHLEASSFEAISEGSNHVKPFVVLTENWICGTTDKKDRKGVIMGGMVFNRSSGYLILPTDGVYYIYSHVEFRIIDTRLNFEASVRMVSCIPDVECNVLDRHTYHSILESSTTVSHLQNKKIVKPTGSNGIYQAGLFHLPAGARINLLVKDPKYRTNSGIKYGQDFLQTSVLSERSYMGAFMVEQVPFRTI